MKNNLFLLAALGVFGYGAYLLFGKRGGEVAPRTASNGTRFGTTSTALPPSVFGARSPERNAPLDARTAVSAAIDLGKLFRDLFPPRNRNYSTQSDYVAALASEGTFIGPGGQFFDTYTDSSGASASYPQGYIPDFVGPVTGANPDFSTNENSGAFDPDRAFDADVFFAT